MSVRRTITLAACAIGLLAALALTISAGSTGAPVYAAGCTAPAWSSTAIYTVGQQVSYNGTLYQAKWWTQGDNPSLSGQWDVWQSVGPCSSTPTPTATVTKTSTATSTPSATASPIPIPSCTVAAWSASAIYVGGQRASYNGFIYQAKWWTQGDNPSLSGQRDVWQPIGSCGPTPTATASPTLTSTATPVRTATPTQTATPTITPSPTATAVPVTGFVLSPYKDITVNMDWNTNVISTAVAGPHESLLSALPAGLKTVTWAFATGECGGENWGGLAPSTIAAANVQSFASAGRQYIISTGGAAGSFTCGSDAGFDKFIKTYYSTALIGIDFDIEGGQSQSDIDNLVQRVIAAQRNYPGLRFSFTLATLGGNSAQSLGALGQEVMSSITRYGLKSYKVNLMVMDYGSTTPSNCAVANGRCDMGLSANRAALNLHSYYGVPYGQIELTPMIGGNDTSDETFTIADVTTVSTFAKQNGLAGLHFWSFDRDTDCAPGYASPTCNTYGQAGTLGFTTRFLANTAP